MPTICKAKKGTWGQFIILFAHTIRQRNPEMTPEMIAERVRTEMVGCPVPFDEMQALVVQYLDD